jgi:hypothetical protein
MSQEELLHGEARTAGAAREPPVEAVLGQALAWLGRSVGFDAARALAYDPGVLIPVSFAASEPLEWEHTVAACRNEQAEADVHKFGDLARSRSHVAVMTAESNEARLSPRWQNLILPDGFRHELRAAAVDEHGHCWGSVVAFRDGRRPFTDSDVVRVGAGLGELAARLSRAMVAGAAPRPPGHAASLWLSGTGELQFTTPTGREWLDRLRTAGMPGRAETILAGLAVRVAASAARAGQAGPPRPVSLRVRGGGQWIALHGETITGPDGQAQGISVVIGPARPARCCPSWPLPTGSPAASKRWYAVSSPGRAPRRSPPACTSAPTPSRTTSRPSSARSASPAAASSRTGSRSSSPDPPAAGDMMPRA